MGFLDSIKESLLSQFETSLSAVDIIFSLLTALLLSLLIILVYRKTFSGVVYNRSTPLTILMLALATALIIRTINANLSLSLGMVGALSIVRFRTAIKDSVDTAYLFWAVTAGIMSGAGLYLYAIIGSLLLAVVYYLAYNTSVKNKKQYLLIISCKIKNEAALEEELSIIEKKQLKSRSYTDSNLELTYQVDYDDSTKQVIDKLKGTKKVSSINLVAYNNDFGL